MIVVDVETSGVDPSKHTILSIGAVEFENPTNQFYIECRLEAGMEVSDMALKINGFSLASLQDKTKPKLDEAVKKFARWSQPIQDKTLAGLNVHFDWLMLQTAFKSKNLQWGYGYRIVDLHGICYYHMSKQGLKIPLRYGASALSSPRIYKYVGLPNEPDPHIAITGAKMEAEALSRLLYGKPLLEEFTQYLIPDELAATSRNLKLL